MERNAVLTDEAVLNFNHMFDEDVKGVAKNICVEANKILKLEKREPQREKIKHLIRQAKQILVARQNNEDVVDIFKWLADCVQDLHDEEDKIELEMLDQEPTEGLVAKLRWTKQLKTQEKILRTLRRIAGQANDLCHYICGMIAEI